MDRLVVVIAKLHNFTMKERLLESNNINTQINLNGVDLNEDNAAMRVADANFEFKEMVTNREVRRSYYHDKIAYYNQWNNFTRPGINRELC
jgi:hypothetical protein